MARKVDIEYIRFYTDGNAARRVAPALPSLPKKPKVRKQKRIPIYVDPVATAGIVLAVVMLALMVVGVFQLRAARQEAAAMEQYVTQLQAENKALQDTYINGYDLETVERLALALGMVPKEEVQHAQITLPEEQEVIEPTLWERICTFFTDLFA